VLQVCNRCVFFTVLKKIELLSVYEVMSGLKKDIELAGLLKKKSKSPKGSFMFTPYQFKTQKNSELKRKQHG